MLGQLSIEVVEYYPTEVVDWWCSRCIETTGVHSHGTHAKGPRTDRFGALLVENSRLSPVRLRPELLPSPESP